MSCGVSRPNSPTSISDDAITERIPIPETGLFEAPIRPAIYPVTAAIISPITTTKINAPPISSSADPASGPLAITSHSTQAIGTITASDPSSTSAIGMSRSSTASTAPLCRARLAAIAERMPPSTGPAIRSKVHTAATPITPAPKKRTSLLKIAPAQSAVAAPGIGCAPVRIGSSTPQAITMPSPIASPTEMPTRWPTPTSANES